VLFRSLMLAYGLDEPEWASRLADAVDAALRDAPPPDLGGSATTDEVTDAVLARLG
jgi:isocitrate/isopropylmalate dehydrogenase